MSNPRQEWMLAQVLQAFAPKLTERELRTVWEAGQQQKLITSFLGSDVKDKESMPPDAPSRIVAFFQPIAAARNEKKPTKKLYISTGDDAPLQAKCVYFVRNPLTKPVKTSVACDETVLSGEVNPDILEVMENTIESVWEPMLKSQKEWGQIKADKEKNTFLRETDEFTTNIKRRIGNLQGDLILQRPNKDIEAQVSSQRYTQEARNPQVVKEFIRVVEIWRKQVSEFIQNDPSKVPMDRNSELGPYDEINYWDRRLPTLLSIQEQLESKRNLVVTGVLQAVEMKDVDEPQHSIFHREEREDEQSLKEQVSKVLSAWDQVKASITDATNEAKDNVRFLTHLRKVIQPLYVDSPRDMTEAIPTILNSLKMIHTLSRHYGDEVRMTNLFERISNQLINQSKKVLYGGKEPSMMWQQDPAVLVETMKQCNNMFTVYQSEYQITKEKLAAMPKGKQFNFDAGRIFLKTTLFCRRLEKLIDMLSSIQQFNALEQKHIDGMETLVEDFKQRIDKFSKAADNLLDYNNTNFERDFVEYTMNNSILENSIQVFMGKSINQMDSIDKKLDIMAKFKQILHRDALQEDLEHKYLEVFRKYGDSLHKIAQQCTQQWQNPPRPRNVAKTSGRIWWARQLLHRIGSPMDKFRHNPKVFHPKDSKQVIKLYNRLVKALMEYQADNYDEWCKLTDQSKKRLRSFLLVREDSKSSADEDRKNGREPSAVSATAATSDEFSWTLHVNFDPSVLELIRDAKHLHLMGYQIPNSAKTVLLLEDRLKTYYNRLIHLLEGYHEVTGLVKLDYMRNLLRPHIAELHAVIAPAMNRLTWTSMNIESFLDTLEKGVEHFRTLVAHVADTMENRIDGNLEFISTLMLMDFPDEVVPLPRFAAAQKEHVEKCAVILQAKNEEIKRAVEDLLVVVTEHIQPSLDADSSLADRFRADSEEVKRKIAERVYQALLASVTGTVATLRNALTADNQNGHAQPLFEVELFLSGDVRFSPSLESTNVPVVTRQASSSGGEESKGSAGQANATTNAAPASFYDTVVNVVNQVIAVSKRVLDWTPEAEQESQYSGLPEAVGGRDFFQTRFAEDKNLQLSSLQLVGALTTNTAAAVEALAELLKWQSTTGDVSGRTGYSWLWQQDVEDQYKQFEQSFPDNTPALDDFVTELNSFVNVEERVGFIPAQANVGGLQLLTESLKKQLMVRVDEWKHRYSEKLHQQVKREMEDLVEHMKELKTKLEREVKDIASLKFVMDAQAELRDVQSSIDLKFTNILERYNTLERYLPQGAMSKEEMDVKSQMMSDWRSVLNLGETVMEKVTLVQGEYKEELVSKVAIFKVSLAQFREDYDAHGPMVVGVSPEEAMTRLNKYNREFETLNRKYRDYNGGERLFGLPLNEYPHLDKTGKELGLLKKLYGLYQEVLATMDAFKEIPWQGVIQTMGEMSKKVNDFQAQSKKLPKGMREWDAYKELRSRIDNFMEVLPLLEELSNKQSMKQRHWTEISEKCGTVFDMSKFHELKLRVVLDANLLKYKDDIEDIIEAARKQMGIQKKIDEIIGTWKSIQFEFGDWSKKTGVLLKGSSVSEIIEKLEDSQSQLVQMITMKHIKPFKKEATDWLARLGDVNETLELWVSVQQLWMSLEQVFTGGDIARQMPTQTRVFVSADREWVTRLMPKCREVVTVVDCCQNEYIKTQLPLMKIQLEQCQKALTGYLENKRGSFPRFYFVSDAALLLILSRGSDREKVQSAFPKIFDSIDRVQFKGDTIMNINPKGLPEMTPDQKDNKKLAAQVAETEMERIHLKKPVKTHGKIEDWLYDLLEEMQKAIRSTVGEGAMEIEDKGDLSSFVNSYCAQVSLLGIQFLWTIDCTDALKLAKGNKKALDNGLMKQRKVLEELTALIVGDDEIVSKMKRTKLETLITIQVHQVDVLSEMKALKLTDEHDFNWQKQLRCYWEEPQAGGDADCLVKIADVPFVYCYEYLGIKERLCVTPLTDRCYISLSQALGMFFGGAPAGPAGTGKTETVKDLGRALGKYVVVFNCSDQMHTADTAKLFKGLCMSGSWGCFDEFNRIELEVLSVVAQQVDRILSAMRSKDETFQFPGDDFKVKVDPRNGFFITMNPGYAGRQELPENLKALFRGVAMMVPDRGIIIKVKLASVGYGTYEVLAKKFKVLYRLCEEQLSKQRHYDFGLRNILSVLRTAGANYREHLKADPKARDDKSNVEEMLMMRTLRDMNLSKLVADDVNLFISLLKDLFPAQPSPPKMQYKQVEAAMYEVIKEKGLIPHESWVAKIIQLYETSVVRHGLMMVGPAGGGKTVATDVLLAAMSRCDENGMETKSVRMHPKAISAEQMFGEADAVSGEWKTGVFAELWDRCNKEENKFKSWIVCDGPVDAIWIENLNTVLDDNKLLTLANGERIRMIDNCRLLFEVQDLRNASPATVSRAGIVFVSSTDLGSDPLVEAWILKRPAAEQQMLRDLSTKYFDEAGLMTWFNEKPRKVIPVTDAHVVANCLNLMDGLLRESESFRTDPLVMERVFVYALTWSIGGLFDHADRKLFHEFMTQIESCPLPESKDGSVYEYYVNKETNDWDVWVPDEWEYPSNFRFSSCLVPTVDSVRAEKIIDTFHSVLRKPILITGGSGTAKTSAVLQYMQTFDGLDDSDEDKVLLKKVNFSSATTHNMFQSNIEADLEKKTGRTFAPPAGRHMTIFLDDMSMPEVNKWGDQPTLEIVRQIVEFDGFYDLDKEFRGLLKKVENLRYVAAMTHPGGGRNDIPNRLKRHFFTINMTPPSEASIDNIYGSMLRGRYASRPDLAELVSQLTGATIELWSKVRERMLPTPAKFHYIFNMRELSRIFQGILHVPNEVLKSETTLVELWHHECTRVLHDKLTNFDDQKRFRDWLGKHLNTHFPDQAAAISNSKDPTYFVDFLRDPTIDPETDEVVEAAKKIYERVGDIPGMKQRVNDQLKIWNDSPNNKKMELVLFTDALEHMMRISRILSMPRGNALLVGVGGSGRQSLTRLAAHIAGHEIFQIKLVRGYKVDNFLEDIREKLYKRIANPKQETKVTWIFTDFEILQEDFLEYINAVLTTGEVAGLIPKEERDIMCSELRDPAKKADPENFQETPDYLYKYFINRVRDNLHVVLCFSPANEKFAERARRFPGLISGCTVDWFLRWPNEALVDVAHKFVMEDDDFKVAATEEHQNALVEHIATVHDQVVEACNDYMLKFRRAVYVTPKSYLSFIGAYKSLYKVKLRHVQNLEDNVKLGLAKLAQANKDVEVLKKELAVKKVSLAKAEKESQEKVQHVRQAMEVASVQKSKAETIKTAAQKQAQEIAADQAAAQVELDKAQPLVEAAKDAAAKVTKGDIAQITKLPKPPQLIKVIMDGVLILNSQPLDRVDTGEGNFPMDSWKHALKFMASTGFTGTLMNFAQPATGDSVSEKDKINEETMEFLEPYVQKEDFNTERAAKSSSAAVGLCGWVRAMFDYHNAAKIVGPKLEKLVQMKAAYAEADKKLKAAIAKAQAAEDEVKQLQDDLNETNKRGALLKQQAETAQRMMKKAEELIASLLGEKTRWEVDEKTYGAEKERLIGDCALACAFISYAGPFNFQFRSELVQQRFFGDASQRRIPVTKDLDLNKFLVDQAKVANWNNQGLPKDELSIQNGILVTQASRYPLLIDPQGQGLSWISKKEANNFPLPWRTTTITDTKLRDRLEFCLQNGKPLLIEGIVKELDPMLDPVLEKDIFEKGRGWRIRMADGTVLDFMQSFFLYLITKLPAPTFSPELSAKTTIIDFSVTREGLEAQLLSRVIQQEQAQLEEQKQKLNVEVNMNTIALQELDDKLLQKLSESKGNLLEDEELISVLADTKARAKEVKEKIEEARDTEESINRKRIQYLAVATRGSVLYFTIVDASKINVMYQNSLQQFLQWFDASMHEEKKASVVEKRVQELIDRITYNVYYNINRSLFEVDKLTFKLMMTMNIMRVESQGKTLSPGMINLLLRGGTPSPDDKEMARDKPAWMDRTVWQNVMSLSRELPFFGGLHQQMHDNEWKEWISHKSPESLPVPGDIGKRLDGDVSAEGSNHFFRLLLIRCLRDDRTRLAAETFVRHSLGDRYVEPMPFSLNDVWSDSDNRTPVVLLLTPGADPSAALVDIAKKNGLHVDPVSMGEGQEKAAQNAIDVAMRDGGWALLQNCHLGLKFISTIDQLIKDRFAASASDGEEKAPEVHKDFRMWITCEPHPEFSINLLQMAIKVTNEPPRGMKAGMVRSFTTTVGDDRLNRVGDNPKWRDLVYSVCFLHSVVQERRKFGPVGWCIPYEFNQSDLEASLTFLERHFFNASNAHGLSWKTIQYMLCEVQYGGRITDDFDRVLFNSFGNAWLVESLTQPSFSFSPRDLPSIDGFVYSIPKAKTAKKFLEYIHSFPDHDSPSIFHLDTNCDLTFGRNDTKKILDTIIETRPKDSSADSGGASPDEEVTNVCKDFIAQIDDEMRIAEWMLDEPKVRRAIKSRPLAEVARVFGVPEKKLGASASKIDGFGIPLNVFLYQEIMRLQGVINLVYNTCKNLIMAVQGTIIMTPELQDAFDSIYNAKPPVSWYQDASGALTAWVLPQLAGWFKGLLERERKLADWLKNGRPKAYWLTGFFNSQGFLTAMRQEITRRNAGPGVWLNNACGGSDKSAAGAWALDDVELVTEVTDYQHVEKIKAVDNSFEGVYVYGLFLEGAGWDKAEKVLRPSAPGAEELTFKLPVIRVFAQMSRDAAKRYNKTETQDWYDCPVYTRPRRTDLAYVFTMKLRTNPKQYTPEYWVRRGLAILCSTE